MIKATVDFVADSRQIKAGQEIKQDTLSADTLLQSLFEKGLVVETEPKKDNPAPKAGKGKSK